MSKKRTDTKAYLINQINPILKPMLQQLTQQRPQNILKYMYLYIQKKMNQTKIQRKDSHEQQQLTPQQQQQIQKKIDAKKNKQGKKQSTRKGISAQVFGQFNQKAEFVPKVIKKSQQSKVFLKNLLSKSIMFQNLSEDNFKIVIDAIQERNITSGTFVIKQGEAGDMLYVIGEGEYECTKIINGKQTYLKTYKHGEFFGQLSLMYNAQRAATIKCSKPGILYALDRSTFVNIVQDSAIKKRAQNLKILGRIQILSQIHQSQKQQLLDTVKQEIYQSNQYVVKQGDNGDRLYFIIQGNLIAQKDNPKTGKKDIVFKYKERQYFGQIALVKNTVRQASVKTVTKCKLISIGRDQFKRLLGPIQNILQRNMQKYKKFINQ